MNLSFVNPETQDPGPLGLNTSPQEYDRLRLRGLATWSSVFLARNRRKESWIESILVGASFS